ncbi:dihydrolipoamide acetyltransferase family protein [Rhodococcus sp. NPDC049939]|uniref:dihydrolipoamide acetyltransferase family protein n=1 Tax=Rhodococcus sp. NPDC049939 TaxID=3155511 RepID=UPI0033FDB638
MSDQTFMLPDLGEGLTEADISEWKVKVGDTVAIDQVVVEVETAKAAVEVPIPFEGTVVALHGAEGSTLKVGTPLITVSDAVHGQYREEERAGSGNVLIGYGTSENTRRRRRRVHADERVTAPAPSPAAPSRVISPVVRKLALRSGLDLSNLSGTGFGGVITRADVETALAAVPEGRTAEHQRIPIKGLRKSVSDKLSTSRREIPDATTWVDVNATALLDARRAINASLGDTEVSLLALLARMTLSALKQFPELNSTVDTEHNEIVRYEHVNLGIAAQTPRGLVVPVIENADLLTTLELAQQLRDTTDLARAGTLAPGRLSGGTFTLNNYGVFGVDGSTPIINHPEAALLGVGRIVDKPWVVDGQVAVRKVTQVSLSFDHRVCDGGVAGGFLRLFADYIENPISMLGWL